jgi:hypothetical protein
VPDHYHWSQNDINHEAAEKRIAYLDKAISTQQEAVS